MTIKLNLWKFIRYVFCKASKTAFVSPKLKLYNVSWCKNEIHPKECIVLGEHCIGNGKVESEFIFNSFPKLPNCALFHLNESKLGWCKLINSKLYFPADWFSKFQTYLHPGNNVQRKKDWFSERKMFRFLCLESNINSQTHFFTQPCGQFSFILWVYLTTEDPKLTTKM